MNGQKRFNEYFAKLILKYCYKDKYSNLQIADKPDLRDIEHNIVIEVVYSMEQDRSEALFLQRQIFCCTDENRKVKLQKKLDTIHKKHKNNLITCPYCKSSNIKKITTSSKVAHTALFGIFSISRNSKNFHCNQCSADF